MRQKSRWERKELPNCNRTQNPLTFAWGAKLQNSSFPTHRAHRAISCVLTLAGAPWRIFFFRDETAVKAVVKTGSHPILYNGPLQCQSGDRRCTILFSGTILFTILSSPPIHTVRGVFQTFSRSSNASSISRNPRHLMSVPSLFAALSKCRNCILVALPLFNL